MSKCTAGQKQQRKPAGHQTHRAHPRKKRARPWPAIARPKIAPPRMLIPAIKGLDLLFETEFASAVCVQAGHDKATPPMHTARVATAVSARGQASSWQCTVANT